VVTVRGAGGEDGRLDNWKEIAGFFGRDERTVKRWERLRGLPVRRLPGGGRGPVFAYRRDLEAWLASQGAEPPSPAAIAAAVPPVAVAEIAVETSPAAGGRRRVAALMAGGALLLTVIALFWPQVWAVPLAVARGDSAQRPAETLYLNGLYFLEGRQAEGLRRAADLFTAAISADPGFAKAYVGLADSYNLLSQYTLMPATDAYPKARAAAERAVALDPRLAGGYAALAFNAFYASRDIGAAARLFERAIALDPDSAQAHHWYALVMMHDRRFDVARREIDAAQRLDPRSPAILANKALILFHGGDTEAALALLEPLAQSQPKLLSPHAYLATIYLASGRHHDFLRAYRTAAELEGNAARLASAAALEAALASDGPAAMLRVWFAEQKRQFALGNEAAFDVAQTAALVGDRAAALDFLDIAARRAEPGLVGIRLAPSLASLADEKAYRTILSAFGFARD
jgi:Tfp pilus assembly protein PilF/phage terminase Nu1 subunit (DNA packaging protein)